ncbi:hypothetical protein QFZ43_000201 [Streptomyces afghaniensis]|nr:hypothetical protein [Streptomyces afghaniensis]
MRSGASRGSASRSSPPQGSSRSPRPPTTRGAWHGRGWAGISRRRRRRWYAASWQTPGSRPRPSSTSALSRKRSRAATDGSPPLSPTPCASCSSSTGRPSGGASSSPVVHRQTLDPGRVLPVRHRPARPHRLPWRHPFGHRGGRILLGQRLQRGCPSGCGATWPPGSCGRATWSPTECCETRPSSTPRLERSPMRRDRCMHTASTAVMTPSMSRRTGSRKLAPRKPASNSFDLNLFGRSWPTALTGQGVPVRRIRHLALPTIGRTAGKARHYVSAH